MHAEHPAVPLVLHVLPLDLPRGAQRYAKALRQALDGPTGRHRILTLFDSPHHELQADIELGVVRGRTGRLGLDLGTIRALRAELRRLKPACLVAHGGEPLKYLAVSSPPGVPLVAYRIGIAHPAAHRPPQRAFHSLLYRRAVRVAGVSQECLSEAHQLFFVPKQRLVLIPNGRDPQAFGGPKPRNSTPRLLFLGHVTASKRPAWFLDVVANLRQQGMQFDAQLVGDGPLLSSISERAKALGVEVLGHRSDVPQLLQRADVLAFTSVPDGEGMPGVFIEAGMSGVVVVSTDVPGARTVLDVGQTGFVTGVHDQAGFADRVAELLRSPDLCEAMGLRARERCCAEFTLQRSVEHWRALLHDILATRLN